MATKKFQMSLRLRHDTSDLTLVTKQLGFFSKVGSDIGEQNRNLRGELTEGTRDSSYRSFPFGVSTSTDLDDALSEVLGKLKPFVAVLQSFVSTGGMASLAVAWFCDNAVGGDRIPAGIIAEMAKLNLTLDLYLYVSTDSSATAEAAETSVRE
jgi:hypothetical protein